MMPNSPAQILRQARDRATYACFTKDMVETLLTFFHAYQRDDVVTLQVTERGLWLINPHNDSRQFLGQAFLTEAQVRRIERECRQQRQKKEAN
jgi:hypothetical protein